MAFPVATGTVCQCSFGAAPSTLMVVPTGRVFVEGKPMACIMDCAIVTNIPSPFFGMCSSMANPAVATATAAASGVLTPVPCTPAIAAPWAPRSLTVLVGGKPALSNMSKLMCAFGGVISVATPSVVRVQIE